MNPEQQERIEKLQKRAGEAIAAAIEHYEFRPLPSWGDVDFLLAVLKSQQAGLNLFRQLVSGKNSLRTLEVFPCNQAEHEDVDCKCFWEQCEAWANKDRGEGYSG